MLKLVFQIYVVGVGVSVCVAYFLVAKRSHRSENGSKYYWPLLWPLVFMLTCFSWLSRLPGKIGDTFDPLAELIAIICMIVSLVVERIFFGGEISPEPNFPKVRT
jgi:hypothetical protein